LLVPGITRHHPAGAEGSDGYGDATDYDTQRKGLDHFLLRHGQLL
jgi:hypothetical protein